MNKKRTFKIELPLKVLNAKLSFYCQDNSTCKGAFEKVAKENCIKKLEMLVYIKECEGKGFPTNKETTEKIGVPSSTIQKWLNIFFKNHNYDNRIESLNALLTDRRVNKIRKKRKSSFSEIEGLKEFCLAKVDERKEEIEKLTDINELKKHIRGLKYSQIFSLAREQFSMNTNLGTFRKYLMRILLERVERNKVLKKEKEANYKKQKKEIEMDNRDIFKSYKYNNE